MDGEGVSSDGSTTSIEDMHPADTDLSCGRSRLSRILRCQARPDPRGRRRGRVSVGTQVDSDLEKPAHDTTISSESTPQIVNDGGSVLTHRSEEAALNPVLTPQCDGDSSLAHRAGESSKGTESALAQFAERELARRTSTRISAVEQLLHDCHVASDCTEQRLTQMRDQQASLEAQVAHLTERLTQQAALLRSCARGGGRELTHRSGATSSRDSKTRSSSANPSLRIR